MPDTNKNLKIATLGHDIERAIEKRKVRQQNYKDYDAFKDTHALNSANILIEIMQTCDIDKKMIEKMFFLVRHHETEGTNRVDLLKDTDSISYFKMNLPLYFVHNTLKETKRRCLWRYKRLSDQGKKVVTELNYQNKEIKSLLKVCIDEYEQIVLK